MVDSGNAHNGNQTVNREAVRIAVVGLWVNIIFCIGKLLAGIFGMSQALVADAVHTLSDLFGDVMILVGIRYWSAPPDRRHPYGHARIETVITLAMATILVVVAAGFVQHSVVTMMEKHAEPPTWLAFYVAVASVLGKEVLYHWTVRVGKRVKSAAIVANAWHHRSDGFSAIPVVLAIAGTKIAPHFFYLDHIGAIIVSVFIFHAAWMIGWPAVKELTDIGAPEQDAKEVARIARSVQGVKRVHAIRTRYIGGKSIQADLHIMVDGNMTVRDGHDISEEVKRRLIADGPEVVDVTVHLEALEEQSPPRVLFLCTGNSCRSQMAEGWARHLKTGDMVAYSAGVVAKGLDPRAVKVMAEAGVDISGQRSKTIDKLADISIDYVITVCGHAHEMCPIYPGAISTLHVGFDDPPKLAADAKGEDEALAHYRRVRDEIRKFVETLPAALRQHSK